MCACVCIPDLTTHANTLTQAHTERAEAVSCNSSAHHDGWLMGVVQHVPEFTTHAHTHTCTHARACTHTYTPQWMARGIHPDLSTQSHIHTHNHTHTHHLLPCSILSIVKVIPGALGSFITSPAASLTDARVCARAQTHTQTHTHTHTRTHTHTLVKG